MYKNRSFGVQILALNNTDYIEAIINIFLPLVDKIAISINEKSWMGDIKNNGEVEKIIAPYLSDKVVLVKGKWKTEAEQRNYCLDKGLPECDYVFIVDDDEMWVSEQVYRMREFMVGHPGYTVFNLSWHTRFKNINWIVSPDEPFKPTVVIQTKAGKINTHKGIRFIKNRLIDSSNQQAWSCLVPEDIAVIEHFSYVRSEDINIKDKIKAFSHANEIINGTDFWYEKIYLECDLRSRYLHPTAPECYDHLIEQELHPEIESALKKFSPKLFEKDE